MSQRRQEDPEEFDGRSRRAGDSSRNGPWWTRWGLVGVLVLGMLGVTTGVVPSALTQTKQAAEEAASEIKDHKKGTEEQRKETTRLLEEQVRLFRVMCVTLAQTAEARRECLR